MKQDEWEQVKEIFHQVQALPVEDRVEFLDKACAGDRAVREKVEDLLESYESGFMADPVLHQVVEIVGAENGFQEGQVIGRYRLKELIGVGGMGEVFLADDTELDRPVAFKVLHEEVAEDQERVRRFIQEAKAASALNHPNIITIHEIGSFEGSRFIVSEYVNGVTLRERMRGGLTSAESLDIVCQIAAALQAAHTAGIVHRDIKPENIMLRQDGLVKVLDFGLAKLTEIDDQPIDAKAPLTRLQTSPGLIMGTVAYMSPEQARGQAVDARTDLWSLGVVFHEMLTGKSPFKGESVTDLVTSILKHDPASLDLKSISEELKPICRKALASDQKARYQTAQEFLQDLQGEKKRMEYTIQGKPFVTVSGSDEMKTQLIRPRPTLSAEYIVTGIKRHKYASFAALVAVVVFGVGLSVYKFNGAPQFNGGNNAIVPVIMESTSEKDLKLSRFTSSGRVVNIAISPDGKYIAYATAEGPGKNGIRLRKVETGSDAEIVPAPENGTYWAFSFSSTSDQVFYSLSTRGDNEIFRVSIDGGSPTKIAGDHTDSGASMSPDGKTIAFVRERDPDGNVEDLVLADPDGSNERVLVHTTGTENWLECGQTPTWAPDGKSIACRLNETVNGEQFYRVYSISTADGKLRPMTEQKWRRVSGAAYMPDGSLIIAAQDLTSEDSSPSQLWRISSSGETKRITNDVTGYSGLSATHKGDVMVTIQSRTTADVWIMNGTDGSQGRQITSSGEFTGGFSWTPDGRILFASTVSGNADIWLMNADGSGRTQLTSNHGTNSDAFMTKDGRHIVYLNRMDFFNTHVFRMDADGKNIKQLSNGPLREWSPRLSPDGKWVYYVEVSNDFQRVCKVSIDGGQPIALASLNEKINIHDVSPKDGRILVEYLPRLDAVRHAVIISPDSELGEGMKGWPGSAVKFDLPASARGVLRFTPDGRYVAFRDTKNGKAYAVSILPINGKGKPKILMPLESDFQGVRWSYDGKQMANVKRSVTSEAILITKKAE